MKVEFGLELQQPITQTILPVVIMHPSTAQVVGYVPISATEFSTGNFSTITLGGVEYTIGSVTMPSREVKEHSGIAPPNQYVAVLFSYEESTLNPWIGISGFRDNRQSGFTSQWNAPAEGARSNWTYGPLIGSLTIALDKYTTVADEETSPGVTDNAALSWTASADAGANAASRRLEFNWIELFKAEVTAGRLPQDAIPLRLTVKSTPASGEFTADLNPNPVIDPRFGKVFNTVRINRETSEIAAGDYEFTFIVQHIVNSVTYSKEVVFTLTLR